MYTSLLLLLHSQIQSMSDGWMDDVWMGRQCALYKEGEKIFAFSHFLL